MCQYVTGSVTHILHISVTARYLQILDKVSQYWSFVIIKLDCKGTAGVAFVNRIFIGLVQYGITQA